MMIARRLYLGYPGVPDRVSKRTETHNAFERGRLRLIFDVCIHVSKKKGPPCRPEHLTFLDPEIQTDVVFEKSNSRAR